MVRKIPIDTQATIITESFIDDFFSFDDYAKRVRLPADSIDEDLRIAAATRVEKFLDRVVFGRQSVYTYDSIDCSFRPYGGRIIQVNSISALQCDGFDTQDPDSYRTESTKYGIGTISLLPGYQWEESDISRWSVDIVEGWVAGEVPHDIMYSVKLVAARMYADGQYDMESDRQIIENLQDWRFEA